MVLQKWILKKGWAVGLAVTGASILTSCGQSPIGIANPNGLIGAGGCVTVSAQNSQVNFSAQNIYVFQGTIRAGNIPGAGAGQFGTIQLSAGPVPPPPVVPQQQQPYPGYYNANATQSATLQGVFASSGSNLTLNVTGTQPNPQKNGSGSFVLGPLVLQRLLASVQTPGGYQQPYGYYPQQPGYYPQQPGYYPQQPGYPQQQGYNSSVCVNGLAIDMHYHLYTNQIYMGSVYLYTNGSQTPYRVDSALY